LSDAELANYISNPVALNTEAAKEEREQRRLAGSQFFGNTPPITEPILGLPDWTPPQRTTRPTLQDSSVPDSFNPRTEISAGDRYIAGKITKHMWIIAVVIPFALALVAAILK
jgi:hypothetical protein